MSSSFDAKPIGNEEPGVLNRVFGGLARGKDTPHLQATSTEIDQQADFQSGVIEIGDNLAEIALGQGGKGFDLGDDFFFVDEVRDVIADKNAVIEDFKHLLRCKGQAIMEALYLHSMLIDLFFVPRSKTIMHGQCGGNDAPR